MKKFIVANPDAVNARIEKTAKTRAAKPKKMNTCLICSNMYTGRSKTCSNVCFKELARQNASNQAIHGGGKKGYYKGFLCDSSYELAFLIHNLDHGIHIERCTMKLSYEYGGKTHTYIPDFIIGQEIYEIKGFMSNRAKEKLRQNPHVKLIDKEGIKPYISYVKKRYNMSKIVSLYEERIEKHKDCLHCCKPFFANYKSQKYCTHSCSVSHRYPPKESASVYA